MYLTLKIALNTYTRIRCTIRKSHTPKSVFLGSLSLPEYGSSEEFFQPCDTPSVTLFFYILARESCTALGTKRFDTIESSRSNGCKATAVYTIAVSRLKAAPTPLELRAVLKGYPSIIIPCTNVFTLLSLALFFIISSCCSNHVTSK